MPLYDNAAGFLGEYDLHTNSLIFLVEKPSGPILPYTALLAYTIGEPNLDTTAKVQIPVVVARGGTLITLLKTVRGEAVRNYSFPIGFPPGNWLRGPLGRLVRNLSACRSHFYLVAQCKEICDRFWLHLPDGQMSALTPGQLITVDEDAVPITATSNLDVAEPRIGFYVQPKLAFNINTTNDALYTVTLLEDPCVGCTDCPCQQGFVAGQVTSGVSPQPGQAWFTTDGFASVVAVSGTIPDDIQITDSLAAGDVVIATYSDTADPATATTGGILIFNANDPTASPSQIALGEGMFGITQAASLDYLYVAVGSDGAIFVSNTGTIWTAVTHATVFPTADWYEVALDPVTKVVYIVGSDAGAAAFVSLEGLRVTDLSAPVVAAGASTFLTAVAVLDDDYIMLGESNGDLFENPGLQGGAAWSSPNLPAVVDVEKIVGGRDRQFAFAGTSAYERSPLTDKEFVLRENPVGHTITGTFQDAVICTTDFEIFPGSANYIVAVTTDGEIIKYEPCDSLC